MEPTVRTTGLFRAHTRPSSITVPGARWVVGSGVWPQAAGTSADRCPPLAGAEPRRERWCSSRLWRRGTGAVADARRLRGRRPALVERESAFRSGERCPDENRRSVRASQFVTATRSRWFTRRGRSQTPARAMRLPASGGRSHMPDWRTSGCASRSQSLRRVDRNMDVPSCSVAPGPNMSYFEFRGPAPSQASWRRHFHQPVSPCAPCYVGIFWRRRRARLYALVLKNLGEAGSPKRASFLAGAAPSGVRLVLYRPRSGPSRPPVSGRPPICAVGLS